MTATAASTIALLDGHSLAHRAFYALPPLSTTAGQPTNAVTGFLNMLLRLEQEYRPDYLAVVFDRRAPTFRHEAYEQYKAQRQPMQEELASQIPLLHQVLEALRIPVYEKDGYEGDDLLGSLARQAEARGLHVLIVTGDRDALQLVDERTDVLVTVRGITETRLFTLAAVREEYGLEPRQLAEVKGLAGDASDNIPGVPGVGEKTALKLIQQFGSIDELYRHLDQVAGKKLQERLAAHEEQARMSRELGTIDCEAPVELDLEACRRREPDPAVARPLFEELELRGLARRFGLAGEPPAAPAPLEDGKAGGEAGPGEAAPAVARAATSEPSLTWVRGSEEGERFLERMEGRRGTLAAAFRPHRPGLPAPALVAVYDGEEAWLFPVEPPADGGAPPLPDPLRRWLAEAGAAKAGYRAKPLLRAAWAAGIEPAGLVGDAELAAYLLDPSRSRYPLEELARRWGHVELPEAAAAEAGDEAALARRLAREAWAVERLLPPLEAELEAMELGRLYREVELPLEPILAEMEATGVQVDPATLRELGEEFRGRIARLEAEIHDLAGEPFNINSTQQLGQILFEKLGLPRGRRTKTGWSTDADVLESLVAAHPIAAKVLEYRQLTKLYGTYVEGLGPVIDPADGRVHAAFNQTVTATGRLSSADPNLQNIPVREEPGRKLRRAFTAPPGRILVSGDYSQIELRVLAHIAGDERLQAAFLSGEDIHRATAAEVFGVPPEAVTPEQRTRAKAVNFGIVYGISDYGLSQQLGISREEAAAFIRTYLDRFPGVRRYMEEVVERARAEGFVRTLSGRIRHLPDLHSRVYARRQAAERTALNTPIQGTAADILKIAMIRLRRALAESGLDARLVLTVHDELILEGRAEDREAMAGLLRRSMEGAMKLAVPLLVEVKAGPNWYDLAPLGAEG
ncbi:MAG: DNA polymerase I [Bacillota bacterium]|nr:DNA polymerase I [Bacillota bacterium]